jgi:pilus assembly protein CpaD
MRAAEMKHATHLRLGRALAILILPPILSLGGCDMPPPAPLSDGATTELPNPLRVSTRQTTHMLRYAPGSTIPDAAEVDGLNAFLAASAIAPGGSVLVERMAQRDPSAIYLDKKRAERLSAALGRQGIKAIMVFASVVPQGQMRLTVDQTVVTAPNCPNWSKAPGNDFDNTLHSDFGCATASNLAAMIDDPRDLAGGRAMGPPRGDAALAAIKRYNTGKVAPLSGQDTGSDLTLPSAPTPPAGSGQ